MHLHCSTDKRSQCYSHSHPHIALHRECSSAMTINENCVALDIAKSAFLLKCILSCVLPCYNVVPLLLFHVFLSPRIVLSSLLFLKVSSLFSSHQLMSPFPCSPRSCTNPIIHFLHISLFCFLVLC